jgi:uncharacterized protein (TIGR04255 family)
VAEYRHLSKPPLREALIDIRISEELPASNVDKLSAHRLDGFEAPIEIRRGRISIQFNLDKSAPLPLPGSAQEGLGWRYSTADGSRVVQFRRDGATFSILKGYQDWDEARSSARVLWEQYREWNSPTKVSRLAVRYINVLNLPMGVDFDLFLTAAPRVPPELPQMVSGFFQRTVIPFSADGTTAIVTQALEPPHETVVPVVLDIDVWYNVLVDLAAPEIWIQLDRLRNIKNQIFFSSITERALEQYL